MNHEFAILPWEYRGSGFDPAPHAITSLELGGRKRDFLLKMRDGIIYFQEVKRSNTFAVLRQFAHSVRGDELVRYWKAEVERENYGRVAKTQHYLSGAFGDTLVVSISRSDFSGWVTDAFHLQWQETPAHRDGKSFDLWSGVVDKAKLRAVHRASLSLFDRAMPKLERRAVRSRWIVGNESDLRRIFSVALRLFARSLCSEPKLTHLWLFYASSTASNGGFLRSFSPGSNSYVQFAPALAPLRHLMEQHFVWTGMRWAHYRGEVQSPMSEKWGEHWRGRYEVVIPSLDLRMEIEKSISRHERIELSLELREWLEGKVSPRQIDKWISQTLA